MEKLIYIYLPVFSPFKVPPSIKDHSGSALSVVNVRVGMPVTLECESNAVPPPVITWYKNGRMITASSNVGINADGQMLHIRNAEVDTLALKAANTKHKSTHFKTKLFGFKMLILILQDRGEKTRQSECLVIFAS